MQEAINFEEYLRSNYSRLKDTIPLVEDLMSAEPMSLYEDDNFNIVKKIMDWKHIRHLPVVDENNGLVGLLTHRDILRFSISALTDLGQEDQERIDRSLIVRDFMQTNVQTVHPKTPLFKAAKIMYTYKYGCLPVIENNKLIGIITESDFLKFFFLYDVLKGD